MIIMGNDKNKAGVVELIMKRMKSGSSETSYDKLKEENEQMTHSKYKEGAEQETKSALDECVSQTMQALESKDSAKFKGCMRNMVKLIMSESEKPNAQED